MSAICDPNLNSRQILVKLNIKFYVKPFSGSRFFTYGGTNIGRWIGGNGQGSVEKPSIAKVLFVNLSNLHRTETDA
jgi:hypothetical protein